MKVYLAGKMTGVPQFNAPKFREWSKKLRDQGHEVFSPVDANDKRYGVGWEDKTTSGDHDSATKSWFDPRVSFHDDLTYICLEANAIALIPGWETSRGTKAEKATAEFLNLEIIHLKEYNDE